MEANKISKANEVSLKEMLDAREKRAWLQQRELKQYQQPLISFTMNIMGAYKTSPLIEKGYYEGRRFILEKLEFEQIPYVISNEIKSKTGNECMIRVEADADEIKHFMIEIEEQSKLGRLFDIDVIRKNGEKISREELGYIGRRCLMCSNPAPLCARNRSHSLEVLTNRTKNILQKYFAGQFAESTASKALRAMLYEISVTPKPGLVDRFNNGSHNDMDFYTFIDSSTVLQPFFRRFTLAGIAAEGDEKQLFYKIREIGKQAEKEMFSITKGVNTHKGLIFSLGLICASAGYLWKKQETFTQAELTVVCASMASESLADFKSEKNSKVASNGEILYHRYGIKGVREEAAKGFPSVREIALPILSECIEKGYSVNDSGVITLLNLLARVYDTNIIKRSDLKTQEQIHTQIESIIEKKPEKASLLSLAQELDQQFQAKNISAGGCADLLAVTWMFHFM